ncbi:MAG: hypothetical protein GEU74_15245, partial [Nitriliruptorales bacterium]|nr:hypothetical protein [Nitriliruptorales bacterium]
MPGHAPGPGRGPDSTGGGAGPDTADAHRPGRRTGVHPARRPARLLEAAAEDVVTTGEGPGGDVTLVFLVRHGQAAVPDEAGRYFSRAPNPLTETGRRQGAGAGQMLGGVRVDAVVASDLLRARQTAEIIAAAVGVPVEFDDQLREVDAGDLDGVTVEDVRRAYPEFLPWIQAGFRQGFGGGAGHFDARLRFPGGESVVEAGERGVAAFRRICARYRGRCVVIVGHAWVNSTILCHVL